MTHHDSLTTSTTLSPNSVCVFILQDRGCVFHEWGQVVSYCLSFRALLLLKVIPHWDTYDSTSCALCSWSWYLEHHVHLLPVTTSRAPSDFSLSQGTKSLQVGAQGCRSQAHRCRLSICLWGSFCFSLTVCHKMATPAPAITSTLQVGRQRTRPLDYSPP